MNYVKLFFKKVVSLTDHLVDLVAFLLYPFNHVSFWIYVMGF